MSLVWVPAGFRLLVNIILILPAEIVRAVDVIFTFSAFGLIKKTYNGPFSIISIVEIAFSAIL